jgi:glycine cleavage system H protein
MRSTRWRDRAADVAALVLLTMAVPVLVVALFVARAALLALAVLLLAGGMAAAVVSRRFREWLQYVGEREVPYKGLRLATDVALGPGHVWARLFGASALVGADDVMQSALGPVDRVELPEVGAHVRAGDPLFRLHHEGRSLAGRSPVSGTVTAVNNALREEPERVNRAPFEGGWAVRIAAENPRRDRLALRGGAEARSLFMREVDRVLSSVADVEGSPALADGGAVVPTLHAHISDRAWAHLSRNVFAQPDAA